MQIFGAKMCVHSYMCASFIIVCTFWVALCYVYVTVCLPCSHILSLAYSFAHNLHNSRPFMRKREYVHTILRRWRRWRAGAQHRICVDVNLALAQHSTHRTICTEARCSWSAQPAEVRMNNAQALSSILETL